MIADIVETAGQARSPRSAATTFEDNRDDGDFGMRRGQAESMLLGLLSAKDADDVSLAPSGHTPQF